MVPEPLRKFWGFRDELYVVDSVIFKGKKMLIPHNLRAQVLEGLYAANQGVTGMMANARDRFFWSGLDAAVNLLRQQCRKCNERAPSQSCETPVIATPPEYPLEQAIADLCS